MEMDKEKRVPPDRQKEAEQQLPPEVEAKMNELSPKAFAIADQTIAAYGKPVEEYDDIDRATMAGLIFGEICALAYENGFARLGWFNGTITAIAYQKLHYSVVCKDCKSFGVSFRPKGKPGYEYGDPYRN